MANRRRRRQKPNQMVWIMLAITMVCVVIVFAIVMAQKEKGTLAKQAKAVTKDMVYENAYIVSNDDGRLIFICDGELYRAKGTMMWGVDDHIFLYCYHLSFHTLPFIVLLLSLQTFPNLNS